MKFLLIGALALVAIAADARREAAAQWCAQYDDYTYTCGFSTFNQCLETVHGVGGVCRADRRARSPEPDRSKPIDRPRNRNCQSLADRNC